MERRLCLSATFTAAPGSPVRVGANPHVVAVGDFNGDGLPDLAVPNASDGTLSVLLGDGKGGFAPAPGSPIAAGAGPVTAAVGDFNTDGKRDLAVADFTGNDVTVLLGNGDGTFTPAPGSPFPVGNSPANVTAADLNGDGIPDLAVPNFGDNTVTILPGMGDGTFPAASAFTVNVGTQPFSATPGDFNGDGRPDLAVGNFGSGNVSMLLSTGTGIANGRFVSAPGSPVAVGGGPYSSAVGDFNGDGKNDLAVTNFNDNTVSVLLGNGDGSFTPAGPPVAVGTHPYSVVSADFNHDRKADLAVVNNGANSVTVLFGNGDGTFTASADSPVPVGSGPVSLSVGDFNQDARPDLLVSNASDNTLSVLLNVVVPTPLPTGTLRAGATATLPASIVGDAKSNATATVTITAPASAAVNGPVTVTLYAAPARSLDGAVPLGIPVTQTLKLRAGARKVLRLKIPAFPASLPGDDFLIAALKAPDGSTTAVAGPSLTVSKPSILFSTSSRGASPASVAPGEKVTLGLVLQNLGNVPASGLVPLTVTLSPDVGGAGGGTTLPAAPLSVKLKPNQSKSSRVKLTVPTGTAPGLYYLPLSLSVSVLGDTSPNDGFATFSTPIKVT